MTLCCIKGKPYLAINYQGERLFSSSVIDAIAKKWFFFYLQTALTYTSSIWNPERINQFYRKNAPAKALLIKLRHLKARNFFLHIKNGIGTVETKNSYFLFSFTHLSCIFRIFCLSLEGNSCKMKLFLKNVE